MGNVTMANMWLGQNQPTKGFLKPAWSARKNAYSSRNSVISPNGTHCLSLTFLNNP